jgi:hypothetical protein
MVPLTLSHGIDFIHIMPWYLQRISTDKYTCTYTKICIPSTIIYKNVSMLAYMHYIYISYTYIYTCTHTNIYTWIYWSTPENMRVHGSLKSPLCYYSHLHNDCLFFPTKKHQVQISETKCTGSRFVLSVFVQISPITVFLCGRRKDSHYPNESISDLSARDNRDDHVLPTHKSTYTRIKA